MKVPTLFAAALSLWQGCYAQPAVQTTQSLQAGGATVSWHFEQQTLIVSATSPESGWVAVGFNLKDDIVHSNLIFAGVENGRMFLADHYVLAPGDHRAVGSLGGVCAAELLSAEAHNGGGTTIRFRIKTEATDAFHYPLIPGNSIWLILAYSVEDDLTHHSRMRKHFNVRL